MFRSLDPEPDGVSTTNHPYGYDISLKLPWAAAGSGNSFDPSGGGFLSGAGAVYIYQRDEKGEWAFYQKIVASDREQGEGFGNTVTLSENQLTVGVRFEDEDENGHQPLNAAGSIYTFALDSNGVWQETQKLVPADRAVGDRFGEAVDMDGSTILAGTHFKQWDDGNGNVFDYVGTAYFFAQDSSGAWQETQQVLPPNPIGGERFGRSLGISGDWAAVGSPREDEDANGTLLHDAGAVYLYQRDSSGQWLLQQVVTPADREAYDWFGFSLDLSDSLLIVGAPWEEEDSLGLPTNTGAGSAYIFRLQPSGVWQEEQKLSGYTQAPIVLFGSSVAIEGKLATVGYQNNPYGEQEEVAVFEQVGNHWVPRQELTDWHTIWDNGFGRAMDLDGGLLITNSKAKLTHPLGDEIGGIYIFENCTQPEIAWSDTICPGSSYPFGTQWLSEPGSYVDTLSGFRACDSIIRLELAVLPPQSNVYETNEGLAISAPGATVQWLNCVDGYAPVAGATDPLFIPSQTGSYAAAVSQYDCIDTSACVAFVIADVENEWDGEIRVFPNPTRGSLQVESEKRMQRIRLFGLQGQIVKEIKSAAREISINMEELPVGVYVLEIETEEGSWRQQVLRR
ncbi:MAG: T9SS type A sorting domain-containing protein [Bacteroidota bacterium]